jgi:hypothetical protein
MSGEALGGKPPWPAGPCASATPPVDAMGERAEARRRVEAFCQSLVDIGQARWRVNEGGDTELHMASGEAYLFGELGLTRLR